MKHSFAFVAALALLLAGAALAHSELETADPAPASLLGSQPAEIRLRFSEEIELRFSTFKVYPILPPDDFEPSAGNAMLRLNGLAGALVSEVLAKRGDNEARVDAGLATTRRTGREVAIELREGLAPGYYVVMWRVLSVDTHTTSGFYVFGIAPEE